MGAAGGGVLHQMPVAPGEGVGVAHHSAAFAVMRREGGKIALHASPAVLHHQHVRRFRHGEEAQAAEQAGIFRLGVQKRMGCAPLGGLAQQGGDDLGAGSVTLGLGGHGDLLEDPSAERPAGQYGPAAGEQQGRTVGVPLVPEPGGGQKGLIRRAQGQRKRRYDAQIIHPRRSDGPHR